MPRRADWAQALEAYLSRNQTREFEYGTWDCFQFMRGAVQAMTGMDLMDRFRPYRTMLGARKQMLRFCDSISLVAFARALMAQAGFQEILPQAARRGDVVMTVQPGFGIVALNGKDLISVTERDGLIELLLSGAMCGWRI